MGNAPPVLVWDIAGEPLKLSPEQAIHIKRASTPYQSPPATNEMAGDSEVGEAVLKENEGIRHSNDVGRYAIYHFGFHAFLILILSGNSSVRVPCQGIHTRRVLGLLLLSYPCSSCLGLQWRWTNASEHGRRRTAHGLRIVMTTTTLV
jgi:hypothetical protein